MLAAGGQMFLDLAQKWKCADRLYLIGHKA